MADEGYVEIGRCCMKLRERSEFGTGPPDYPLHYMALSMYVSIAIILVGSLFGCAAPGEAFKPAEQAPGMSLIYFFIHKTWPHLEWTSISMWTAKR